ncbi:uncharacterized protein BT62DRAFT_459311 [Guyanagaster necrorhizus]|uniref:Uncharacterized protein n=1 Tax=Guyanagaster necrorhizus TaxID=856835 RepID=A0A9P7VL09_9AGAR|nr:uncharacterized protein BT62DRAFT_459311 [Guyanagaster necrorhizus MCA 3950]KAG7441911.1 hypothetical protein BT62DRAFT_459311 [Guyanagaster necrorhizus MCA 3950]
MRMQQTSQTMNGATRTGLCCAPKISLPCLCPSARTCLKTIWTMIVIRCIHSRSPLVMNRPGYPPSHQSGLSQPVPANSPAFVSTSLTSVPAYGAVTNVQTHCRMQDFSGIQTPAPSMPPETSSTSRSPSGWSAPSRQTSHPCRCRRGRCRWRLSYPIRMTIAVHEESPFQPQSQGSCLRARKLSIYQKETFLVS